MTLSEQNIRLTSAYQNMNAEGREVLDRVVGGLAEIHRKVTAAALPLGAPERAKTADRNFARPLLC